MSLQKLMTNYADYNAWANQQFVNWLSTKSDELDKEATSSFSSIGKTLRHILATEEYWFSVIAESEYHERNTDELKTDEIMNDLLIRSNLLAETIKSLSEQDLTKKIKIVHEWFESDLPRFEYLQHIVNHGTYHRGQIVTIARNIGLTDAPMTDYNFYNVMKSAK